MENNNLILLNGRSNNDYPSQFMYISTVRASVIDLVWCNQMCVEKAVNFSVQNVPMRSDHLSAVLTVEIELNILRSEHKITKLKWDDNCLTEFRSVIGTQLSARLMPDGVDEMSDVLIQLIHETAKQLGMQKTFGLTGEREGKP